jgi:hypothetical protein
MKDPTMRSFWVQLLQTCTAYTATHLSENTCSILPKCSLSYFLVELRVASDALKAGTGSKDSLQLETAQIEGEQTSESEPLHPSANIVTRAVTLAPGMNESLRDPSFAMPMSFVRTPRIVPWLSVTTSLAAQDVKISTPASSACFPSQRHSSLQHNHNMHWLLLTDTDHGIGCTQTCTLTHNHSQGGWKGFEGR